MALENLFKFGSSRQMAAALESANLAINPALVTAGITTIQIDGKPLAASDAPLADKIKALLAVAAPGVAAQQLADVVAHNDQLSSQVTALNQEKDSLASSNQSLSSEVANLRVEKASLQTSIETLNAQKADQKNQLDAALNQVSALTQNLNAANRLVSQMSVEFGCLDLRDEKGAPLAATATPEQKLASAERLPIADKINAAKGAVNVAVTRITGVAPGQIPATGANGKGALNVTQAGILTQYEAAKAKSPADGVAFYRKNAEAIDAACRAKQG